MKKISLILSIFALFLFGFYLRMESLNISKSAMLSSRYCRGECIVRIETLPGTQVVDIYLIKPIETAETAIASIERYLTDSYSDALHSRKVKVNIYWNEELVQSEMLEG